MDERNWNGTQGDSKKRKTKEFFTDFAAQTKTAYKNRGSFVSYSEKLQRGGGMMAAVLAAFGVMVFFACVVFFLNLRGAEEVLVPEVVGKNWETALLELQAKELNARIQLRFSDAPGDAGTVLEQSPKAGAIVKGNSRVSLVMSRGAVADQVGDYVGKSLEEVQLELQTLFAGSAFPLIRLAEPDYKFNAAPSGTVLEQEPPPGTSIVHPIDLHVIVSRGSQVETVTVPQLTGKSIKDVLESMRTTHLAFNFTAHRAAGNETAGTVTAQQHAAGSEAQAYTPIAVELALPEHPEKGIVYGLYTATLSEEPFPVPIELKAYPIENDAFTVVRFYHPGGALSIPYAVPAGTMLELSVAGTVRGKKLADDGAL